MSNKTSKAIKYISLGFREKIAIILTLLITFIMLISVYLVTYQVKNASMKRALETGRMLGRMIALSMGEAIVRGNFRGVDYTLKEFVKLNKIEYCMITNNLGKIISSSNNHLNGKYFSDAWSRSAIYSKDLSIRRATINGIQIYDTSIPIIVGGNKYGIIRIGFSLEDEYKNIRTILLYNLTLGSILILLGLFIAYGMSATVLAPLNKVLNAIEALSKGDYSQKAFIEGTAEFADLSDSFNRLSLILNNQNSADNMNVKKNWQNRININPTFFSGKLSEAAILHIKISDFNSFIERHSPSEAIETINEFYNECCKIISESGGIIDKLCDGRIYAIFPIDENSKWPSDLKAVYSALLIRENLNVFNFNQAKLGLEQINVGSGVAFGKIVVGNIGPKGRQEFSCVGRTIDRAIEMSELSNAKNGFAPIVDRRISSASGSFLTLKPINVKSLADGNTLEYFIVEGFTNLTYFKERFDTSDETDSKRFIQLFGLTSATDGLEVLISIIEDEDSKYRKNALRAISSFINRQNSDAKDFLTKFILECKEDNLRAMATMILGWKKDKELVPFFKSLVIDKNSRVRANALEACISLNFPDKKELFKNMLNDESPRVCANALLGLWISDDHETLSHIYTLLKSDNYKMRASAAYAVGFLASARKFRRLFPAYKEEKKFLLLPVIENIIKRLKLMLESAEKTERHQSLKAIAKIGGSDLIENIEQLIKEETSSEIISDAQNILSKWQKD